MRKKIGLLIGAVALLVMVGAACTSQEQAKVEVKDTTPIKIGWIGALTGDVSSVGTQDKLAAELAVKEINEAGGINGRQLIMIAEDGACDSKIATNAGQKLINVDKVTAIAGGLCSGETLAVAPTAEAGKVPMLSYGSTAPKVSEAGDYIFRNVPSDSYQGKYAANFVYNTLGKRKAAVVYAITDYTEAIAKIFSEEFKKLGGEVVLTDTFLQDVRDLRSQMTKVKNSDADILYFPSYTEAGIVGLKEAQEFGLTMPILGAETFSDPKILAAQGSEGLLYTAPVSNESETFKTKYFAFAGKTDNLPVYASQAYDAVNLLAMVMKKVGTNPEAIKNELYNVKDYQGASGKIGFDKNGDITSADYQVMKVMGGKAAPYQAQ